MCIVCILRMVVGLVLVLQTSENPWIGLHGTFLMSILVGTQATAIGHAVISDSCGFAPMHEAVSAVAYVLECCKVLYSENTTSIMWDLLTSCKY